MAFRVHKYLVAIMDDHLRKNKNGPLPIVVPLVLYSGWQRYNYSTDLFDLFGKDRELAQEFLCKPFKLIDLSIIPNEELKDGCMYGIVARILKHAHEKNVIDFLKSILQELKAVEKDERMRYIYTTLSYIFNAYEISKEAFIELVRSELPFVSEEKLMTIAEQYRQEGYQKGQLDGIEKSMEKGRIEALKTVAINLFGQGINIEEIAKVTGLSVAEIEQLKSQVVN